MLRHILFKNILKDLCYIKKENLILEHIVYLLPLMEYIKVIFMKMVT